MVPTVTGFLPVEELGRVFIHEHVTCADWSMRLAFGERLFPRQTVVDTAVRQYEDLRRRFGHGAIVDGTPINLGRDIDLLREISEGSGMPLLVSTGFYFIEQPQLLNRGEREIYELLLGEIRDGIDGTGVYPAMIKCAVSRAGFTPLTEKLLTVAGRLSAETGLPLFCHTEVALEQGLRAADIFEAAGADPALVVMGHSGDSNDLVYLEKLLARGYWLGMDRFCIADTTNSMENRVRTLLELHRRGWTNRLLLAGDRPVYGCFGMTRDPMNLPDATEHYADIYTQAIPGLSDGGMSADDIERMLTDNPRRLFSGL